MGVEADRVIASAARPRRTLGLHGDRGIPAPRVSAGLRNAVVAAAPAVAPTAGGGCCHGGAGGAGSQQWVGGSGALESLTGRAGIPASDEHRRRYGGRGGGHSTSSPSGSGNSSFGG